MAIDALILAGGAGTRLRPLVSDVPKPLAPVGGRPFLEYLLLQLRANEIGRAVICAGYRADAIAAHLGDGTRWGVELAYSVEDAPLGTGGALRRAASLVGSERLLAMNGDSFFDIPLADLEAEHVRAGATLTLALARVPDGRRYGGVRTDADGWVSSFVEKGDVSAPQSINGGLYIMDRTLLDQIPADRPVSLESEVLPSLVGRGLHAKSFDAYFIDIGVPGDYVRAQADGAVWERLARAAG